MINYAPQLFSGSLDTKTSTYGAGHSYVNVCISFSTCRSREVAGIKYGLDVTNSSYSFLFPMIKRGASP